MSENIRKRGNTWHYDFKVDGVRYRGSCQTDNKNLAEKIASTIKTDILRQKHDLPTKVNYNDKIFSEVWEEYIGLLSNSKETIKNKIFAYKHFTFANKSIKDISAQDIEYYQLQRKLEVLNDDKNKRKRESEINFRWINLEIATLRHFFNFCIKRGFIEKNPAAGIKKLNELSRLKTLSDVDIEKLIAGATNKLTRDLITFLIYTGCRKGEALNLKWDDVDLKNGVIAIKGTKTKYDRHIPISDALKAILTGIEREQDSLYVFERNGAKIGDFKRSFHTACRNAGFKDLHIHDLRHVFASKMVMGGTSLYITGELLGHRTTQMTKRYSHLVPETLRKAVNDVFNKKNNAIQQTWLNANTFIISDTHFGHANIMQFEPARGILVNPAKNVSNYIGLSTAADLKIIENWNFIVGRNDNILHLGDVVIGGKDKIANYVKKLNGHIYLISGNHDVGSAIYEELGVDVIENVHSFLDGSYDIIPTKHKYANAIIVEIDGKRIMFSHFPVVNDIVEDMENFAGVTKELYEIFKNYNCDLNIHGHTHSTSIKIASFCKNASIEAIGDFKPRKIGEII
ncbi:MAG: tyrosine-type recombinase/integrase [bacterium]